MIKKKLFSLFLISILTLIGTVTSTSGYTVESTAYVWVPIGFAISPIYGNGDLDLSATTTVTASADVLKVEVEDTRTFTLGNDPSNLIQNGEAVVKLQKYKIQQVKCSGWWECAWWRPNTQYLVTPLSTFDTQTLQTEGDRDHGNIPTSVTVDDISSATFNVRYYTADFINDLRGEAGETYTHSLSTTVELSATFDVYGIEFGFSTSYNSATSNSYFMSGSYLHYGDYKGGTVYSWSYYVPVTPPCCII